MNNKEKDIIKKILYNEDSIDKKRLIKEINNPEQLFSLVDNYNWNDGFEIPKEVIDNEFCDLSTALLTFYLADGYRLLEDRKSFENKDLPQWGAFIKDLFDRIQSNKFNESRIEYKPELTKVQKYKLIKSNPDVLSVFFEGIDGELVDTNIE